MPYFERAIAQPGSHDPITLLPPGFTGSPNDGHLVTLKDPDGSDRRDPKTGELVQVIAPGLAPDNPIRMEAEEYAEAQKIIQERRAQKAKVGK